MKTTTKKPTVKTAPFDLAKALAGHPLVTRDGRKVTNFKKGNNSQYPYTARVADFPHIYTEVGSFYSTKMPDARDLFLAVKTAPRSHKKKPAPVQPAPHHDARETQPPKPAGGWTQPEIDKAAIKLCPFKVGDKLKYIHEPEWTYIVVELGSKGQFKVKSREHSPVFTYQSYHVNLFTLIPTEQPKPDALERMKRELADAQYNAESCAETIAQEEAKRELHLAYADKFSRIIAELEKEGK